MHRSQREPPVHRSEVSEPGAVKIHPLFLCPPLRLPGLPKSSEGEIEMASSKSQNLNASRPCDHIWPWTLLINRVRRLPNSCVRGDRNEKFCKISISWRQGQGWEASAQCRCFQGCLGRTSIPVSRYKSSRLLYIRALP